MICDECHERQATVMVTQIINGKKSEAHLCQECAKKHSGLGFMAEPSFTFNNILAGLFEPESLQTGSIQVKPKVRCENCGLTFADFRRLGTLGCSQCYSQFETLLEPLLKRIHGSTQHTGKLPARSGTAQVRRELEDARRQLRDAISIEAYEKAAELRDRIKELEKTLAQDDKS
jgi:protein arginine kinase activator